jgi:hypothetical protein
MLAVPLEAAKEVLCATYKEKFDWNTFVYDIIVSSLIVCEIILSLSQNI